MSTSLVMSLNLKDRIPTFKWHEWAELVSNEVGGSVLPPSLITLFSVINDYSAVGFSPPFDTLYYILVKSVGLFCMQKRVVRRLFCMQKSVWAAAFFQDALQFLTLATRWQNFLGFGNGSLWTRSTIYYGK